MSLHREFQRKRTTRVRRQCRWETWVLVSLQRTYRDRVAWPVKSWKIKTASSSGQEEDSLFPPPIWAPGIRQKSGRGRLSPLAPSWLWGLAHRPLWRARRVPGKPDAPLLIPSSSLACTLGGEHAERTQLFMLSWPASLSPGPPHCQCWQSSPNVHRTHAVYMEGIQFRQALPWLSVG